MSVVVVLSNDELGRLALARAVEEAQSRELPLVVVASASLPHNEAQAAGYADRKAEVEQSLARAVDEIKAKGVPCVGYLPSSPAEASAAALEAAKEHGAELIVVGLRRRSPVGKLVLGSMSQDILLGADCEVLAVKLSPDEERNL